MRTRRFLTRLAFGLLALTGTAASAQAPDWPTKPIHLLVNGAPGSLPDLFARPLAEKLRTALGQTVVVENRPGAGGLLAMQALKNSAPDGHTLAIITNAHAVWNPYLFANMTYDPAADLLPVSPLAILPMALAVPPGAPFNTLQELVTQAKAAPGSLNYASSGNGSPPHILFELFKGQAGIDLMHVPFRSGPDAVNALLGDSTQAYLAGTALLQPLASSGKLKVLAVGAAERQPNLPDVPTFAEAGYPGFEQAAWLGLVTRSGVPDPIVQRLNTAVADALRDPAIAKLYETNGSLIYTDTPAGFANRIEADRKQWDPVMKKAGITPG